MNTAPEMRAITRLLDESQPPLTREEIAERCHITPQTVSMYRHFHRFPTRNAYAGLVDLAIERGVVLLATDFLKPRAVA
jgi:transcriptional regulator with XRE-family HTH domain